MKRQTPVWLVLITFLMLFLVSCKQTSIINKMDYKNVYKTENTILYSFDTDNLLKMLNTTDDGVYVVNFWATWCVPCVDELPCFEAIQTTYKHKNVHVILVSVDAAKTIESNLIPFIEKNNIQSTVIVLDEKGNTWMPKVYSDWSGSIPFTIIFSKDKKAYYERMLNRNELKQEIKKFLDEH